MKKESFANKLQIGKAGITASFAICFLLFIFGPLEFYLNNSYELWCNSYDVLRYMFPIFMIALALSLTVFFLMRHLNRRLYYICIAGCLALLISLYVQGTFFVSNLPPLDGRTIDWSDYCSQRVESIVLWSLVFLIVLLLFLRLQENLFDRISSAVCGFVFLILFITSAIMFFSSGAYKEKTVVTPSESYILDMSDDENFIILLLDAIDGEAFSQVLDYHPEYAETFEDFTSFTNVTSGYPYTAHSIPFIIGGEWLENKEPLEESCKRIFKTSPLLNRLKSLEYRMGLYDPDYYYIKDLSDSFENISFAYKLAYPEKFAKMYLLMTGYRYFPFALKKYCVLTPENFYVDTIKTNGLDQFYSADNLTFLERLKDREVVKSKEKCFRFIYVRGAHEPFVYPSQSEQVKDNTYLSSIELSVSIASEYIDKLKAAGVYDNSVIVIVADHGYVENDVAFGRQNPAMLIKGKNEKHEFKTNDAPVSHEDLQIAFLRLLDGSVSDAIFDWQEGDSRERRFIFYNYGKDEVMWEYYQNGHASDESTMVATGKEYILKK